MLIVFAATMIVLGLTYYFAIKGQRVDPSQLSEPRASLLTVGVQIICGDCAGDEDRPIKTYLDRLGNCNQCGGHSFVLASSRALYAQQLMASRMAAPETAFGNGRVIPFEVPLGARASRADKIAV